MKKSERPPLNLNKSLFCLAKYPTGGLTRGRGHPNMKKIQNSEGVHPEISILCGCNRFFWKSEGGVLNKYKIGSLYGLVKKQPQLLEFGGGGPSCLFL